MEQGTFNTEAHIVNVLIGENAVSPKAQHSGDAGFDLVAASDPKIVGVQHFDREGCYLTIDYIEYDTGVRVRPPKELFSVVVPRSSISNKNLVLANSVGLIDTGYRDTIKLRFRYVAQPWDYEFVGDGEITVTVHADKIYKKGDRIGQLVFFEHKDVNIVQVDKMEFYADDSSRGEGGFGSTGN